MLPSLLYQVERFIQNEKARADNTVTALAQGPANPAAGAGIPVWLPQTFANQGVYSVSVNGVPPVGGETTLAVAYNDPSLGACTQDHLVVEPSAY